VVAVAVPLLQELMGQLDHLQEIQEEELEVLDLQLPLLLVVLLNLFI
tara:strand:+ start:344 stop:484 length:141 start_codon:yes stop_codon:yes gene_type:complete